MSMRTIARSSSNRKSASDLASSVLPVPVGPRNRNDPVGRLRVGDPGPRAAYGVAHRGTASAWPISRSPITSSIRSSLAVSPSSIRPVGMPVQASTTSAICSAPTSSPTSGSSSAFSAASTALDLLLQRGDPAVQDLAGRLEVALAQAPLGLDPQLVELPAQLALALQRGLLPLPPGLEPAQLLLAVGEVGAQRGQPLQRCLVGLLLERELLHLQPVDLAPELVDLLRATTRSPSAAGRPPRRSGRSPCRAAAGR